MKKDEDFMRLAFEQAQKGLNSGGIPIGSVLVHQQKVLGSGHNKRVQSGSTILHGEMDALESAGRQSAEIYANCVLYTTLSPCSMCSGAILLYGIPRVVIGDHINFMGEEDWLRSRGVEVVILEDKDCIEMMRIFIEENPALWNEDIGEIGT